MSPPPHTHTHTTQEYYSAIKNEIFAICNNMDVPGEYYVRWNKSEKDKYCIVSFILGSKTYNKLVNIRKKRHIHRYREQTNGYQWGNELGE